MEKKPLIPCAFDVDANVRLWCCWTCAAVLVVVVVVVVSPVRTQLWVTVTHLATGRAESADIARDILGAFIFFSTGVWLDQSFLLKMYVSMILFNPHWFLHTLEF